MWLFYAFLSAFTAALVAIFGKLGLAGIDTTLATSIRALIMAGLLTSLSLTLGKFNNFSFAALTGKEWIYIFLSGLAGAASWLFYFFALKIGPASPVAAIDRLSIVFVIALAALFLGEAIGWKSALGAFLIVCGAILVTLK